MQLCVRGSGRFSCIRTIFKEFKDVKKIPKSKRNIEQVRVYGYCGSEKNVKDVWEDLWRLRWSGVKMWYGNLHFKLWGLTERLAGNNRELSEGPPCRSASWVLTRLSDQPGNKSHGWVLNSLRPDRMQGAGDDWWEGFPVRLRGWRMAGTGPFQGWDMRVNIIFPDTPFPSIVTTDFYKYLKEIIKT